MHLLSASLFPSASMKKDSWRILCRPPIRPRNPEQFNPLLLLAFKSAQLFFLTAARSYVTRCNATMTNTRQIRLKNLGEVEQAVMDYIWTHGPSSSEACREALASSRPMKDSTIRTVLRRLEEKGYLTHEIQGRTFIYRASDARQSVAVRAVKGIIDRFCGGSAEELVLGMVDSAVLSRKQLERLARSIDEKTIDGKTIDEKIAAKKEPKP